MTAVRRGLVLGSGGVLGFAWLLGALDALQSETGLDAREAQVAIGTSAGSVAAALLGCGLPVEAIIRHHQGIPAPGDPLIDFDYQAGVGSALPPRPGWRPTAPRLAGEWVRHPRRVPAMVALSGLLPPGRGSLAPVHALVSGVAAAAGFADRWPDSPRPWIVAADQLSGRRIVFGKPGGARVAALADAVQASCSIPGWYPPVVIGGVPYVDGGAVSIASVDLARAARLDEVYVLAPMAAVDVERPHGALARVVGRARAMITRRIDADVAMLRSAGVRVCFAAPGPRDLATMGVNLMDPRRRTEVLDTARETAAEQVRGQLARFSRRSAG